MNETNDGIEQWAWPDGGSYLDQCQIVCDIFKVIIAEMKEIKNG